MPFTPDKHGFPTPIVDGKDEISLKYILKDKNDSLLIDKIIINFNRTVKKEFLSAESENKYDDISYELKINYDKKSERAVKNILHDDLNSDSKEWSEFIKNLLLVSEIEYALQNKKNIALRKSISINLFIVHSSGR